MENKQYLLNKFDGVTYLHLPTLSRVLLRYRKNAKYRLGFDNYNALGIVTMN